MAAARRPWTAAEEAELRERVGRGEGYHAIAASLGRSYVSCEQKATKLGVGPVRSLRTGTVIAATERPDAAPAVELLTSPEADEEPIDALWERAVRATGKELARAETRHVVTLRVASRTTVALSISSDWHVRPSGATHLESLDRYCTALGTTPGAYGILVGDVTDNPIKHRPQNVGEVWPSLRLADRLLARCNGRMLAMTSGNHDDWTGTFSGVPSLEQMAKRRRIHYAPDHAVYLLEIVDPDDAAHVTARYTVAVRHQYRRHSSLNWTHAAWRWLEENVNDWPVVDGQTLLPDVLYLGHHHCAEVATRSTPRGDVHALRGGAWQMESGYSRALGFPGSRPTAPTVLFPAQQGRTVAFASYEEAFDVLRARRADAA